MARLEWVMEGIYLASGRQKPIPVTFHRSPARLINRVAITASPEGKQCIFTSLASEDIYTSQERFHRD